MYQEKIPEKWMLVIDPPRFLIGGGATAPEWIGEACVGLQLGSQLRDFQGQYFTISSDHLVRALREQEPQSLASLSAAEKLDDEYCINECFIRIYPAAVEEIELDPLQQAK
jgi:hypothetical protein